MQHAIVRLLFEKTLGERVLRDEAERGGAYVQENEIGYSGGL